MIGLMLATDTINEVSKEFQAYKDQLMKVTFSYDPIDELIKLMMADVPEQRPTIQDVINILGSNLGLDLRSNQIANEVTQQSIATNKQKQETSSVNKPFLYQSSSSLKLANSIGAPSASVALKQVFKSMTTAAAAASCWSDYDKSYVTTNINALIAEVKKANPMTETQDSEVYNSALTKAFAEAVNLVNEKLQLDSRQRRPLQSLPIEKYTFLKAAFTTSFEKIIGRAKWTWSE